METLLDFLSVALVVQLEEALKDFTAGRFADREAKALLGIVESVVKFEIGPAVGGGHCFVHLDVEITEPLKIGAGVVAIVEAVVNGCQALVVLHHEFSTGRVVPFSN